MCLTADEADQRAAGPADRLITSLALRVAKIEL